jgi:transposase
MRPYSQDLRERVVNAIDEGRGTRQQIADLFGVSTAWIRRRLQRRRETGSFTAKPHGGGTPLKLTPQHSDRLLVLVTEQPDATLAELRDRLGAAVHLSTVARALARLRLTFKKKVLHAAEQDRPDVQHKRATFRGRAAAIDPSRFVFLDETGVNTSMDRRHGRAPRGQRLVDKVPLAHWQMTPLVAGVRGDAVVAPFALTGAMDGLTFESYVEQILVPSLRPGDIVVLDRLQAHRGRAVGRAIRKSGAGVWYLPPYSPDYNPIENIWAKVKSILRQTAARTQDALWEGLRQAVAAVTAQDCLNTFAHCGYHATPMCEAL